MRVIDFDTYEYTCNTRFEFIVTVLSNLFLY